MRTAIIHQVIKCFKTICKPSFNIENRIQIRMHIKFYCASETRENESEEEVQEIESTKSVVWNFFHVESDSDGRLSNTNKPICCKCLEPVAASYGKTAKVRL